ncbi:MAG: prolipoprotein diacylglyceryl transferase [Dissulfurispiraceae bacterium]|jgi:phosphatidylglycerol:prolipoprotein diacylglycerol transferase
MITYPNIRPEIVKVGPFTVRWYGMMYLIGFALSYLLVRYQIKAGASRLPRLRALELGEVDSLYSYLILGLLIGARLGYVVFYNLSFYFTHPMELFAVWHGGMSFHGGLIGSVVAGFLFCKKFKLNFWHTADLIIVTAPIGLGFGRLGNFINGELFGRVTGVPWAMVFPSGGPLPRHPSQLYEFFLEGVVLFIVLWTLRARHYKSGMLTAFFLVLYGAFRFFAEFFREPDEQLGFVLGMFTMGQVLSLSMLLMGVMVLYLRRFKTTKNPEAGQ